jgi:hypothetical protein
VHACLSAETGRPIRLPADVFKTSPASDQE